MASEKVQRVHDEHTAGVHKIYDGLCHKFPVLVITCGLCQALAFSKDKAAVTNGHANDRNKAHELLLNHVGALLPGEGDVLVRVQNADAQTYLFYTRRVLASWIYFKRFAVSILKVDADEDESAVGSR